MTKRGDRGRCFSHLLQRPCSRGRPREPLLVIRWPGRWGTGNAKNGEKLPSSQSGRLGHREAALHPLLQESDVPHGLSRGLPLECEVSLQGLVRVGDRVSLFDASHRFGMRRSENETASYPAVGRSSSLKQESHEVSAASHRHCSRKHPFRADTRDVASPGDLYRSFMTKSLEPGTSPQRVNKS